jgi:hypothetical protein
MRYGWLDWSLEMTLILLVRGCEMSLIIAYQWIVGTLLELDRGRGYRAASKLVDALNETWARYGEVDVWEIVGRVFQISWNMVRNEYATDVKEDGLLNGTEWGEPIDLEVYS